MPLALYTFGMFIAPAEDPVNDGFHALNDPVLQAVDQAPGLIARSGYASDLDGSSWGPEVYPHFYQERGDGWSPATLSLWADPESLFAFTYHGLHAAAFRRGREGNGLSNRNRHRWCCGGTKVRPIRHGPKGCIGMNTCMTTAPARRPLP